MKQTPPAPTRRTLLAGFGGAILSPAAAWMPVPAAAQSRATLALRAELGSRALRPGASTPAWLLTGGPDGPLRFKRGDEIDVTFQNDLPVPVALNWRGLDGAAAAEPMLDRPPVMPGGKDAFRLPLRHAGTMLLDARLLGDGAALPLPVRALVVMETAPPEVDRDEVWQIEDFRLRTDGSALAPGADPQGASPLFTINGRPALDLKLKVNDRLRIRIINSCQRSVIALRIENTDIRVVAIDGQPAQPFSARNSQLVLAPGTRIEAFIDVSNAAGTASDILLHDGKEARPIGRLVVSRDAPVREKLLPPPGPLSSNGLPAQLDLKSALRVDLAIGTGTVKPDWIKPTDLATSAPTFRAKTGRVVVLAITNREKTPAVFYLHGHHFRLLDRLDDGWKPYWLDTLAFEAGQTQRIAFAAEYPGRWSMEAVATDWAAPRLMRWFEVT